MSKMSELHAQAVMIYEDGLPDGVTNQELEEAMDSELIFIGTELELEAERIRIMGSQGFVNSIESKNKGIQ